MCSPRGHRGVGRRAWPGRARGHQRETRLSCSELRLPTILLLLSPSPSPRSLRTSVLAADDDRDGSSRTRCHHKVPDYLAAAHGRLLFVVVCPRANVGSSSPESSRAPWGCSGIPRRGGDAATPPRLPPAALRQLATAASEARSIRRLLTCLFCIRTLGRRGDEQFPIGAAAFAGQGRLGGCVAKRG